MKKIKQSNEVKDLQVSKEQVAEMFDDINSIYGENAVTYLGQDTLTVPSISTQCYSLDKILGNGGFPRGRIVEVYGKESSGKTTTCLHVVAEAQQRGELCAIVDAEHALDSSYCEKLGINLTSLIVSQPQSGEQALNIVQKLVKSGQISVIVVDSVSALTPQSEIDGEIGDSTIALQARMMSQAMRKLVALVHKSNVCLIFINQVRSQIGMFTQGDTTTGGKALRFYSSIRLEVVKTGQVKQGENVVGITTKAVVRKNKVAAPFKQCVFEIMFGKGISKEGDILDIASSLKIVDKKGAWYYYDRGGERITLGQGKEKARENLEKNQDLFREILNKVKERDE